MPPLKTPVSLLTISTETFSEWFLMEWYAEQGTDFSASAIKDLPSIVFNAVVGDIIKKMNTYDPLYSHYENIPITSMFTFLLTERLTHLDLSTLNPAHFGGLCDNLRKIFIEALPALKNLEYLSLEMKKLKTFNEFPPCDDDIVFSIGTHCNSLKYLNMSNNTVTNKALSSLIPSDDRGGCPLLEDLILKGWTLTSRTCLVEVLRGLPNIKNLRYNNLYGVVREFCKKYSENSCVKLKLEYMTMKRCDNDLATRIGTLCPQIETLKFILTDEDARNLAFFTKVCDLNLNYEYNHEPPGNESRNYFLQNGYKLKKLRIACRQFHTEFFKLLGKSCPNLSELSVHCFSLIQNFDFDVNEDNTAKEFSLLTSFCLEVGSINGSSGAVPVDALHYILKSTCNLTCLKLKFRSVTFTDERFKHLWNSINTKSLDTLDIVWPCFHRDETVRLTMSTVRLVLDRCPLLTVLGNLFFWNISQEEIESLRRSMRECNYDIEILGECKCGRRHMPL